MKKALIFLILLFVSATLSARIKFDERAIRAELRKPGVKLVAVDFYMTGCPPCDKAIKKWKELKNQYGDTLKLIVVSPMRSDGSCNIKGWYPDRMICDNDQEIAGSWGVRDFPQAFLYSWHNDYPLLERGQVNDVEEKIKEYLKNIPRVVIDADKNTKNLVPLIEEELSRNSKIELVANESERDRLLEERERGTNDNYDDDLQCTQGKEISANSVLKVTQQGVNLVLKLSSVERSCTMAAATKTLSSSKRNLKTEIASAVYDLLLQIFGHISMPDEDEQPQKHVKENTNSSDSKACEYAKSDKSLETWNEYIKSFPNGECSFEAKQQIKKLEKKKQQQTVVEKKAEYTRKVRKIGDLTWSERSPNRMNWSTAKQYCENFSEGNFTDWRLPNIDELRALIKKHPGTKSGGGCMISEKTGSLSQGFWTRSDCKGINGNNFSELGDSVRLWSSSVRPYSDNRWYVDFSSGEINETETGNQYFIRCVR